MRVAVLIPALNEEQALPGVLQDLARVHDGRVVVVDNGSTDRTAEVARAHGAEVVHQPTRGYGSACLAGLGHLRADPPDVVVILDADHSDDPAEMASLLAPLQADAADMVLGERRTRAEPGALTWPQRVGNRVATAGIRAFTGHRYRDMGPFRAVRWAALERLEMQDPAFGWNVEMQMKAARAGLRVLEVPVSYRDRQAGDSKISGTVRGTIKAGTGMLRACWRYR
ncbi:MAG: glycosyltransferase family 2 protein [Alphaproteobacteria bacterium]|nr:glycosyltransferase family 2 protein [Alphaproteobacteria bacterium]